MSKLSRRRRRRFFSLVVLILIAFGLYHSYKPLPQGLSFTGDLLAATEVRFFADLTYLDVDGERRYQQSIFDEVFAMISSAERFILIDMFLFNSYQGAVPEEHRALSVELTQRLIAQKDAYPQIRILFITDPINSLYGGIEAAHIDQLQAAGVSVTYSRLTPLRDSNPVYSVFWRTFFSYWGNDISETLPNPISEGRVSLRTYLSMMNFKANHRKVVIADSGQQYRGLVTSANPHDGSSAHGNVALSFGGPAVADLLATEMAVLQMSGGYVLDLEIETGFEQGFELEPAADTQTIESALRSSLKSTLQVLTEKAIEEALIETIAAARDGDRLDVAVFYLSDRHIVQALLLARQRGVQMRVLLDPNKDAFGRIKNGIPNRQTAHELQRAGIPVRWCDTHGEQCHSKLLLARYVDGSGQLILGSANYTRRNLDDLNLETSVRLTASQDSEVISEALDWFDLRWSNRDGRIFSAEYEEYADETWQHLLMYRVMEASGLSTF